MVMKERFNLLALLVLAIVGLNACQKDGERLVVQPASTITLTSNVSSVSLTADSASRNAVAFSWTPAQYGYNAAVRYTLQLDKAGNAFKAPVEISAANSVSATVSVADLNQAMLQVGLPAGSSGQLEARVRSELVLNGAAAATTMPTYSAATTITATPYLIVVNYPSLYVPGAYQGWALGTAPKISSVQSNNVYEGYVNFTAASPFKLTSAPNWDNTNYGTGGTGKLSTTGDNLTVATPGYYLIKADLNALTWSATPTTWAVIGAATPKGWDADTPLTYDPVTNTWRATVVLAKDAIKFRANGAWDINFGDTKADGVLDYGGDNILVPAAGTYTVVLNLSNPGNYTYSLIKQ